MWVVGVYCGNGQMAAELLASTKMSFGHCFCEFLFYFYFFAHLMDRAGVIMFLYCLSVCAYVPAGGGILQLACH